MIIGILQRRLKYVANQIADRIPEDYATFPKHIKLMEDTGIGDVVREQALAFLPAKSLCRFKTVSKEWDQWINNPFFVHIQTTQFKSVSGLFCQLPGESPSFISLDTTAFGVPNAGLSFLPEPVDIRTTCNGLICCQGRGENQAYYVCNPVNKGWWMLPKPKLHHIVFPNRHIPSCRIHHHSMPKHPIQSILFH